MRPSKGWVVCGIGCLLLGLWCMRPTAAEPIASSLPTKATVDRTAEDTPLRLPVRMVSYIPSGPAKYGKVFLKTSFVLDYRGGPVTLSADAEGTRHTHVDDQLTMRVTRPDGTTSEYQGEPAATWQPPLDLSKHFQIGINRVEVELRDLFGDCMWCTDLWLTGRAPKPAQLPLLLIEGQQPQFHWPSAEMFVAVNGPPSGSKVVFAGDVQGATSTWVAGEIWAKVTHADGSVETVSHDYTVAGGTPGTLAPVDVTSFFRPGTNIVEIRLSNSRGGVVASSPLWLALVPRG